MLDDLSSYRSAFEKCISLSLQEFVDDNIQHAEIRHCFTAELWEDDGSCRIDDDEIIPTFATRYESFQQEYKFRVLVSGICWIPFPVVSSPRDMI